MKVGLCGVGHRLSYLAALFRREIPGFELVQKLRSESG